MYFTKIYSEENKKIHERLLQRAEKYLLEEYPLLLTMSEYTFEPQYLDEAQDSDYYLIIDDEPIAISNDEPISIPGTNALIKFPKDLPIGAELIVEPVVKEETEGLVKGTDYKIAGDIFRFTFDNDLEFEDTFTLIFSYDNKEFKENEIGIYYYNPESNEWEAIKSTVDPEAGTVTANVNHFSIYGLLAVGDPATEKEEDKKTEKNPAVPKDDQKKPEIDPDKETKGKEENDSKTEADQAEGKKLPATATNHYNLLMVGMTLLSISFLIYLIQRKRNKVSN